jgi:predicted enzyme related to lactoylglutathione lyase
MPNIAHFAINADDVARARRFYEGVFGWTFNAWGPPNFYQLQTHRKDEPAGILGALQGRRELLPGQRTNAFECTVAVSSIEQTEKAVLANGGKIVLPRSVIVGVGTLTFFEDTEGNAVAAIQFDQRAE